MQIDEIVSEVRTAGRGATPAPAEERRADLSPEDTDELVERIVEAVLDRLAERWRD